MVILPSFFLLVNLRVLLFTIFDNGATIQDNGLIGGIDPNGCTKPKSIDIQLRKYNFQLLKR